MPESSTQSIAVTHRGKDVSMEEQKYYRWLRRIQSKYKVFNLSNVAELCGISQSSLYSAIKMNRDFFIHAEKLRKLYEVVQLLREDEEF